MIAAAALLAAAAAARPSVLLITLDTTRADHIGCYGARGAETPALDALAARGVRFAQALSPTPLTLPSHVSMLTGRVPRRHGVRDNALFRLGGDVPVLAESFRKGGYHTAAFVSAAVLEGSLGIARGFEVYDDAVGPAATATTEAERRGDRTVDAALRYLGAAEPPFFVWVHLYDPHAPYAPPEPYAGRFAGRPYDGEIAFMDAQIARLVAAAGKRAGSLVVAAAGDHGESLGEHGEEGHGIFVYQATQRVPLIVAGPGAAGGRVVAETVGLVDIAPTLAELAGVAPPAGADGRSLASTLRAAVAPPRRDFELESYYPLFSYGWAPLRAIVRGGVKYVEAPRPEMYDLAKDPGERTSVRTARRELASELSSALFALIDGDTPTPQAMDPALAEHARKIASLGYVGGSSPSEVGDVIDPKDGVVWIADLTTARKALAEARPADGIAPASRLLAKNPTNLPALMTLAACYQESGKLDEAIKIHRRTLTLYPKSALAWTNLAGALAERSKTDPAARAEAKSAYERALAIDPEDADALHGLSWIAFAASDFKAAERYLARELDARPTAATARALGDLRAKKLRDPAGARAAYARALALTPEGDPTRAELKALAP